VQDDTCCLAEEVGVKGFGVEDSGGWCLVMRVFVVRGSVSGFGFWVLDWVLDLGFKIQGFSG